MFENVQTSVEENGDGGAADLREKCWPRRRGAGD